MSRFDPADLGVTDTEVSALYRMRPPTGYVTVAEACHILGCSHLTYRRLTREGKLPPRDGARHRTLPIGAIEEAAGEFYRWRRHLNDPNSYWLTDEPAARILNVAVDQVEPILAGERLPFVDHADGVRMYRREQVEQVAAMRAERWQV
jgi:excisionase family DNA binding protein